MRMNEVTAMKKNREVPSAVPVSEKEARLVTEINRVTGSGNAAEVRKVDDGYSVMEVRKKRKLIT